MSRFELVAIPRAHWEAINGLAIADFVADALGCERRMSKDVNLDNEYGRYSACCQRLEQKVATSTLLRTVETPALLQQVLRAGQFPVFRLAPSYISILGSISGEATAERFGKTFFPPAMVASHRRIFQELVVEKGLRDSAAEQRLAFFKAAEEGDCGIVELQSAFHPPETEANADTFILAVVEEAEQRFVDIPPFDPSEEAARLFSSAPRKKAQASILRKDIREALQNNQPVTFGNRASHDVITEVLNEFVFAPGNGRLQPAEVRVVYADGSEAEPFPVFALQRSHLPKSDVAPVRAALMSMRHLLLDADIDFCWFRNREVSKSRTLAEADEFCLKATLAQLQTSLAVGPLLLHLFHTGFEPAVIGFYRGLVRTLERSGRPAGELEVVPFYFRSGQPYERGAPWRG